MNKFLAFSSALIVALLFVLFNKSKLETHSVFYISGENLYELIQQDGSFGVAPAFFLLKNIPALKETIDTGEYEIQKEESAISVIAKMLSKKKVIRKLTIPEGYTVKRILEVVNNNKLLFGNITEQYNEASLAPNTYFYSFGDSKSSILHKMKNQMEIIKAKYAQMNNTSLNFTEILILASMIEKESGNKNELALISSVFHNRLSIKMRLQSDPTVIYALTDGYGKMERKLTRKDLWFQSPYNTYRNAGLPPTPICCPGENAIYAAMYPLTTRFFYFVAKNDHSGHIFSEDYKSHLQAIRNLKMKKNNRKERT